jgi:AbrB family looped-hinge helix DNA binding protein
VIAVIVTVSSKYQVVIPQKIRKELNIQPGEKFQVISYGDRLEFVPVRNIKDMRGFLRGINTTIERDGDRL